MNDASKRKDGHSALRVRDGKIETFDPNPNASMTDAKTPTIIEEALEVICTFLPPEPDTDDPRIKDWQECDEALRTIRTELSALQQENAKLREECEGLLKDAERLKGGLAWYADGHHYQLPGWDSVSGESENWLFPDFEEPTNEQCEWMIDNGGVARSILDGKMINTAALTDDNEDEITIDAALSPKNPT